MSVFPFREAAISGVEPFVLEDTDSLISTGDLQENRA